MILVSMHFTLAAGTASDQTGGWPPKGTGFWWHGMERLVRRGGKPMRVLVTGATGNVGRHVVEQLVAAGVRVRAMTRNPGQARFARPVETVSGDLTDPAGLAPVLAGVDRLYLFPVARTAREVVERARSAGVKRIVVLSSAAVTSGADTSVHPPVEQAVEQGAPEWTHVRPGEFMLNKLLLWGPSIRAEGVVYEPFPEAAWWPVHEKDVADVATAALLQDGHHGQAYDVSGPELITRREQVAAIAAATGRPVRLAAVSPEEAREHYRRQGGFAAEYADFLFGFTDYQGNQREPDSAWYPNVQARASRPTAERVTGRPARTFAQWAHDHADDLRPSLPLLAVVPDGDGEGEQS
jgi:uncharacterized protein YbjT (DUF2867 family)